MKTIQMTIDEGLLQSVDKAVEQLKTTRSDFIRQSVQKSLRDMTVRELEARHRQGYRKKPVKKGEFDAWEKEQEWGGS